MQIIVSFSKEKKMKNKSSLSNQWYRPWSLPLPLLIVPMLCLGTTLPGAKQLIFSLSPIPSFLSSAWERRKHLIFTLLLAALSTILTASTIEFLSENIDGKSQNILFIAYSEFFPNRDSENYDIDNNIIITIVEGRNNIVYQNRHQINMSIDTESLHEYHYLDFQREYYPFQFTADLEPDDYQLIIMIESPDTGQKRRYRENFAVSRRQKEVGFAVLVGSIDEFRFALRDKVFLNNRYQNLEIWQPVSSLPDSTAAVIKHENGETVYLEQNRLTKINNLIPEKKEYSVKIVNSIQEETHFSEPIFPSPGYFFKQRYTPREQLAQMRNIVNQKDYRELRDVDEEHLQEAIDDYWRNFQGESYVFDNEYRQIFYERVLHADENFGVPGYLAGWQTDRGRVYIKYGEPDSITSEAFPLGRDPSISWHYYSQNRTFTFYDLRGYGHYELRQKWID